MEPYQKQCQYCETPIEMRYVRKFDGSYKWLPKTINNSHPKELWETHTCLQDKWGKNHFSTLKRDLKEKGFESPKTDKLKWNLTDQNLADLLQGKRISLSYDYPDGKKVFLVLELHRNPIKHETIDRF